MSVRVRDEAPADHARVAEIHTRAFARANEAVLVAALRESAHPQLSLVAERDGLVVAHVFFSPLSAEGRLPTSGALAPVAVDPEHQGAGVGSLLIRAALARCPSRGWRAIFLVGNPAYYARFGFVPAAPRGFHYRDAEFDAWLQVLELAPGALAGCGGWLLFDAAFERAGT